MVMLVAVGTSMPPLPGAPAPVASALAMGNDPNIGEPPLRFPPLHRNGEGAGGGAVPLCLAGKRDHPFARGALLGLMGKSLPLQDGVERNRLERRGEH